MAIYDILNGVKDIRESGEGICTFNGFLEDYLSIIEADEGKEEVREVLETLFEEDHNLKVAVDLHLNINKEALLIRSFATKIHLSCRMERFVVHM